MSDGNLTRREVLSRLLALGAGAAALGGCASESTADVFEEVLTAYGRASQDLPDPSEIERVREQFKTVRIYDRTGRHLLCEVMDPRGDRTYVPLEKIPLYLQQAVIAMEDRSFYANPGVDPVGIARAFLANLRGEHIQGGSTITMQLVKNVLIPPEQRYEISYERKMKEVMLALEISRRYPGREGKDRILEWYLNTNFLGNRAYGVEAGAQAYFGKHVWELSLAEAAMLAHLPQNPSLNPIDNPEMAKRRQEIVLDTMVSQGYLTEEQAEAAKRENLVTRPREEHFQLQAPHFALYVRDLLEREFGDRAYSLGLRVYTTLDLGIQRVAEQVAAEKIAEYGVARDARNAAVVVMRPSTGEILAMVGSVDYYDEEIDGQVNMALAPRQPGSSFKPYTYLTAFEEGYTAATMILDTPVSYPNPPNRPYSPMNIDRKYHGAVRLRRALGCSYNVPAVKLLNMVGVDKVVATARRLGITTLTEDYYGLSLTLGAEEVRLLDQVFAYSVFANGGHMVGQPVPAEDRRPGFRELEPVAILLAVDSEGNIVKQYTEPEVRRVADPRHVYILNSILSDPEARKPAFGRSADYLVLPDRPVATKTGSTDGNSDAWTVGYTPQYTVGVWVGNADRKKMRGLVGSTGAGPIYHEIMKSLHVGLDVIDFERPPGIVEVEICDLSGMLPTECCPKRVVEVFVEGTEPTETCTMHQLRRVNRETGQEAASDTPAELVEERIVVVYPEEAADWVRENQAGLAHEVTTSPARTSADRDVAIISYPSCGAVLRGKVRILGTATSHNLWYHKVEYSRRGWDWTTVELDYMKTSEVAGGVLATWDTTAVENGTYQLRAVVVDKTGNYVVSEPVEVTVAN